MTEAAPTEGVGAGEEGADLPPALALSPFEEAQGDKGASACELVRVMGARGQPSSDLSLRAIVRDRGGTGTRIINMHFTLDDDLNGVCLDFCRAHSLMTVECAQRLFTAMCDAVQALEERQERVRCYRASIVAGFHGGRPETDAEDGGGRGGGGSGSGDPSREAGARTAAFALRGADSLRERLVQEEPLRIRPHRRAAGGEAYEALMHRRERRLQEARAALDALRNTTGVGTPRSAAAVGAGEGPAEVEARPRGD